MKTTTIIILSLLLFPTLGSSAKNPSNIEIAPQWMVERDTTQFARLQSFWESAEGWYLFYRNRETGEYRLQRTNFSVQINYSDYCGEWFVNISAETDTWGLFLIRGLQAVENPIKSLNLPTDELLAVKVGETFSFDFGGKTYTLRAEGEINENPFWSDYWNTVLNYRLYLSDGTTEQLLTTVSHFEHTVPAILWIGDLDGDGRPDFAISVETWFENSDTEVFLSSEAGDGKLVRFAGRALMTRNC